ncbi:MAG: class I tRNA ligase family protein, partial [Thermoplasmata archaeon]
HETCVGSFAELGKHLGGPLPVPFDPHRPHVDRIQFPCPTCSAPTHREPYTIDAWFDSGAAPFAQFHYPFEPGPFDPTRPLDFVCEGLDQTRGWFYTMLVLSTALFDRPAYRTCLTTGLVLDESGQKMSKSMGNAIEPLSFLEAHGGDALRWAFYVGDYTEPLRVSEGSVRAAAQRTLGTLVNVLDFYRENARESEAPASAPVTGALLDRWILARLSATTDSVTRALDLFEARTGALALQEFVQDLSNWYLRRSRTRLWSEEETEDRRRAERTLGYVLRITARLLAPFAPFTAEAIHQEVSGHRFLSGGASVHAESWPPPGPMDPELEAGMADLRGWVEVGRELRQRAGVKSRTPLPAFELRAGPASPARSLGPEGAALLEEELNVRSVIWEAPEERIAHAGPEWLAGERGLQGKAYLNRTPPPELLREGWLREALRRLQSARKSAGLAYHQRIDLDLWASEPLRELLAGELPRLTTELLADAPTVRPLPAPEGQATGSWEFEGFRLEARIRARAEGDSRGSGAPNDRAPG